MTSFFNKLNQFVVTHPEAVQIGLSQLAPDTTWLEALRVWLSTQEPAVLVSVVRTTGSTPRQTDAKMLVSLEGTIDTIGGGQLEYRAVEIAQAILMKAQLTALRQPQQTETPPSLRTIEHFALGARAGQCCGGSMDLAFEVLNATDVPWVTALTQYDRNYTQGAMTRSFSSEGVLQTWQWHTEQGRAAHAVAATHQGAWTDAISVSHFPIAVFGAGHVGQALMQCLQPLSRQLFWIDSRDHIFPAHTNAWVTCIHSDEPAEVLADLPPNCAIVVLTHSHALDLDIVYQALQYKAKRGIFPYIGLIGSTTKRLRFEHQLALRGLSVDAISPMVCPIGSPEIQSKMPAALALAVAHQLQAWYEASCFEGRSAVPHTVSLLPSSSLSQS